LVVTWGSNLIFWPRCAVGGKGEEKKERKKERGIVATIIFLSTCPVGGVFVVIDCYYSHSFRELFDTTKKRGGKKKKKRSEEGGRS